MGRNSDDGKNDPALPELPGRAPGVFYHLTMSGSLDDMPIGLFADPQEAINLIVRAGYISCEPLPAWDTGEGDIALARNTIRGASIVWGMGPSEPMGYKLAKYSDGRVVNVAIYSWDDDNAPDVDENTPEGQATLREWCRENWIIPTNF